MAPTRKRRYVGNTNVKKRLEIEASNNSLPRRFNEMNFLPSPEKKMAEDPQNDVMYQPTPPKKPVKDILAANVQAHQIATKNYKVEAWYKSPAGIGSVANTVAAALSAHDKNQSGYISCDDVISTLQQMNFGLKEYEVRELLSNHDASITNDSDSVVHYRSFAKQFDIPRNPEDEKMEDPLTRQERYIRALQERVATASKVPVPSAVGRRKTMKQETKRVQEDRVPSPPDKPMDSHRLPPVNSRIITERKPVEEEKVFTLDDLESELRTKLPSPTRYSAKLAPGVIPQTKTTLVLGGDMRNTPNSLKRAKLMPQVIDQRHREATRQAKRHIIADHLDRINAYAAQADYHAKLAEENHIKATSKNLLKYHQSFFESQSQLTEKVHQKGLIHSDIAKHNHNVSSESMFHHPG